jgi:hypothetical protein
VAITPIASASATISSGESAGMGSTLRSPSANRRAEACSSRSGLVTERATAQPIKETATSTTAATATNDSQNRWIRSVTSWASTVRRKTPCTVPPEAIGTAT